MSANRYMYDLTNYAEKHYPVDSQTLDMIDNICDWAADHYEDKNGNLTQEGIHFIDKMFAGVADMWLEEIRDNWREAK